MATTRRLIEEWLPIAEIGIESVRERTPMTPFPAPNRLHVWWARRPLVASRAAVMASLLPSDADREKFMHALGIHGDPVAAKERIAQATRDGVRLGADAYGYPRAFSYSPSREEKDWLAEEAGRLGIESPSVLDPTAGGGAIPFEALRLGIDAYANDLNPVASFVEKMTFEAPLLVGVEVLPIYRELASKFVCRAREQLSWMFPEEPGEDTRPDGYLWTRTMRCPHCGGVIPLSPDWRLAPDGTGVRIIPDEESKTCSFEIVRSSKEQSAGTVGRGRVICPYPSCGRIIGDDMVRRLAREEAPGEQIYAVVYKRAIRTFTKSGKEGRTKWERGFRAPRPEDDVMDAIRSKLAVKLPEWEARDIVPTESILPGLNTNQILRYGVDDWKKLFSPRQLYCHGTGVEIFRELLDEEQAKGGLSEARKAAFGYLAVAIDKIVNFNTRGGRWHLKLGCRSFFDRHDMPFKWSYSEMAPLIVGLGYDWAFEQIEKCVVELISFLRPDVTKDSLKQSKGKDSSLLNLISEARPSISFNPPQVTLSCQSGDCLWHIFDRSIDAVVMDPPYYDNVMYAELSDFFYVWLKRTAGYVYPELFTLASADKENEAVANPVMFNGQEKPRELAGKRYQERMASIFAECRRVLKEDGILLLMFTHKATGAWDALAKGLFDAGFSINASWPINTEAEGSLSIKDKAAANSTIFLVCRPRPEKAPTDEILFWEDLEPLVRKAVVERARKHRSSGIHGIDLYLSCFGPALEEFSKHWPVRRGTAISGREDPYEATPGDVLQTARAAVKDWRVREILKSRPNPSLDPLLAWYILAWDTFKAPTFPYDEALNLARVTGLDLDKEVVGVVAEKKASDIVLWDSATRAEKTTIGPIDGSKSMLDALHRIANTTRKKSMDDAVEAMRKAHLDSSPEFKDALSAVLEVLPVSRKFSGQDVAKAAEPAAADFEIFETLRIVAFRELERPRQLSLLGLLQQE